MNQFDPKKHTENLIKTAEIYGYILSADLESHNIGVLIDVLIKLKESMPVSLYEKQDRELQYVLANHKYIKDNLECTPEEHNAEMNRLRKEYNEQPASL